MVSAPSAAFLFVILGRTLPTGRFKGFPLFVGFGVFLNPVAMALVALTVGSI